MYVCFAQKTKIFVYYGFLILFGFSHPHCVFFLNLYLYYKKHHHL